MTPLLLALLLLIVAALVLERRTARRDRAKLAHIVYVNGTRGKSTVTRLIDAGLRAGGLTVFCKTTGTLPMTIGVDGQQRPLARRGKPNIREQLRILHRAAKAGAQVLVIECMAVDPALQVVSQHEMLLADIGVLTNVRLDHTEEMGGTLDEICDALCSTIPRGGVVFTADAAFFARIGQNAEKVGARALLAVPDGSLPDLDFAENVALALAVCQQLGVPRQTALDGMAHHQRDPFALSLHRLPGGGLFINGLSINDPQSTALVWQRLRDRHRLAERRLILLINNRPDRGARTEQMLRLAAALLPDEVWLCGASRQYLCRRLGGGGIRAAAAFADAAALPLAQVGSDAVVFAVGNLAGAGHGIMQRIEQEATRDVS